MALIKVHVWDGENRHETEVGTYAKAEAFVTGHIGSSEHAFGWIESPNGKHFTMVAGQTTRGDENLMGRDAWYALKPVTPVEVTMSDQPTTVVSETIAPVQHVSAKKPGEILHDSQYKVNVIRFKYVDNYGRESLREGIVANNPDPFVNKITGERHHLLNVYANLREEDPRSKRTPYAFRQFEASRMTEIVEVGPLTCDHPAYQLFTRIQPQAKVLKARDPKTAQPLAETK